MHQQIKEQFSENPQSLRATQRKCLIIEDSEFDSIKLTRVIANCTDQLRVRVATTLATARAELAVGETSLILLDNNLPDGLGANFVQELASDDTFSGIPVIMVSDWPSPFMWEKAASAGVHYVLNKAEFDGRYVRSALEKGEQRRARVN